MVNSPFNAYVTTNAAGSFNTDSTGFTQGTVLDNAAARQFLAAGVLGQNETLPMWGGVAISEAIPGAAGRPSSLLGPTITRATTNTLNGAVGQVTGFSVFDENASALNAPLSPVPLVYSGGQVNFFRFGCGARVPVAMDPSLIDLEGNVITSQVSWDFTNQVLQPYVASGATEAVTSMTWSATNGGQVAVVMAGASVFGLGDTITVAGATNGGTGGTAGINTAQVINTWTDTTHFTFLLSGTAAQWGNGSAFGGTITLSVGVGALPVRVSEVQIGKSMVVAFNPISGVATWARSANVAIIVL